MFLYICLQIVYDYTLLYIRPFFWFRSFCPPGFRSWCHPWFRVWCPPWCQWWRFLPSGGGAFLVPVVEVPPVWWWYPPVWWRCLHGASCGGASMVPAAAFLVPVVEVPSWCQWWRCLHGAGGCLPGASGIHSRTRRRVRTPLLSAAGSLASELKVSGLFSKCDCSKYQLFVCPF